MHTICCSRPIDIGLHIVAHARKKSFLRHTPDLRNFLPRREYYSRVRRPLISLALLVFFFLKGCLIILTAIEDADNGHLISIHAERDYSAFSIVRDA